MTAIEFGKALNSMGYGRSTPQGPQLFPRTENQEVTSKVQRPQRNAYNIDSFSTSSNINSDMFQSGYMSLTPWWITNDRLVGKKYQGADLAIAEARRRRKFSERAMNELSDARLMLNTTVRIHLIDGSLLSILEMCLWCCARIRVPRCVCNPALPAQRKANRGEPQQVVCKLCTVKCSCPTTTPL